MSDRRENAKTPLLRRTLACLVSAAMVTAFTPIVAWGAEGDVSYQYLTEYGIWKSGSLSSDGYSSVSSSTASWGADGTTSWYVLDSDVTISQDVTFTGDVRLVLAESCTLTVDGSLSGGSAIGGKGSSLTIYGQERGAGALVAGGDISGGEAHAGKAGGGVTIYGGSVTAEGVIIGGAGGSNFSGGTGGSVAVYGGALTAGSISGGAGGVKGAKGGSVAIRGGKVTVNNNIDGGTGGGNGGLGSGGTGGDVAISGGVVVAGNISGGTGGTAERYSTSGEAGVGGALAISGGTVTVTGNIAAGKGGKGGNPVGSEGDITISGGFVVTGNIIGNSFNTGASGSAVLFSESEIYFNHNRDSWSGVVFDGVRFDPLKYLIVHDGTRNPTVAIHGSSSIFGSIVVGPGAGLVVLDGATLANNGAIYNNGTLYNRGTVTNYGTIENSGTVYNYSTIANNGSLRGEGPIQSAITLHANGGSYSDDSAVPGFYTFNKEGDDIPLPYVTKAGYDFLGWYEDSDFSGDSVEAISCDGLTARTLYAKWEPAAGNIEVSVNDHDFGTAEYGYQTIDPIEVAVKANASDLGTVTLSQPAPTGPSPSAFKIGELSSASISADGGAVFTIKPDDKLNAGTYSETIAIKGVTSEGRDVEARVSVSFTVEKATPTIEVTPSSTSVKGFTTVELVVSSDDLPEGTEYTLACTQGTEQYPAETISIERVDNNRFEVLAPNAIGAYQFCAKFAGNDNFNEASAACTINVNESGYSVSIPDSITGDSVVPPGGGNSQSNEIPLYLGDSQREYLTVKINLGQQQAEIQEVGQEQLETITAGEGSGLQSSLVLDLSKTGSTVTSVKMSKETFENIASAINSSDNAAQSASVVTSTGTVELSKEALSSIASQVSGDVTVGLSEKGTTELGELQQLALEALKALYGCYEASVTSGGSEVHAFGSGTVTLSFPFAPAPNTDPKNYRLAYVSEAGKLEYCPTTLEGNVLSGTTSHLSTYAIVYIEPAAETLALNAALGALPAAGELKAAEAEAAVAQARGLLAQVAALADDQRAIMDEALVANAEQVVARGTELIEEAEKAAAEADAKAVSKVRNKAFSVKAGVSKSIAFKTKASAAGTKVTYEKVRGSKYIKVTKAGKVTAKKGLKAGKNYTAKVKVTCGKAWKYVTITVKAR